MSKRPRRARMSEVFRIRESDAGLKNTDPATISKAATDLAQDIKKSPTKTLNPQTAKQALTATAQAIGKMDPTTRLKATAGGQLVPAKMQGSLSGGKPFASPKPGQSTSTTGLDKDQSNLFVDPLSGKPPGGGF